MGVQDATVGGSPADGAARGVVSVWGAAGDGQLRRHGVRVAATARHRRVRVRGDP